MTVVTISITLATSLAILLLALVTYRKPAIGYALFIFSLPFERIGSYPLNPKTGYPLLHPAQIVGAALVGAYILRYITRKEKPRLVKSLPFLGVFLITSLISARINNVQEVWQIFVWLLFITAVFFVVAQFTITQPTFIKKALAVTLLVVSIFGIYQFFGNMAGLPNSLTGIRTTYSKEVLGFPRLQSTALEPLYFANYLFLPLFVLSALLIENGSLDGLSLVALMSGLAAFILTFSRGAWLSGSIGLVVLIWALWHRFRGWIRSNFKSLLVIGLVLFTAAVIVVATSVAQTKNSKVGTSILKDYFTTKVFHTTSFTERLHDEKLAFRIWEKHPIFGVGIGGFGSAYYGCHIGKCVYRPNNQALEVLAEGGVVGFTIFYAFLVALLVYGWRAMKRSTGNQRAMLAGLIAATIAMVVQSQTFSGFLCCLTYTWGTLGLLAGLSAPTGQTKKIKTP